jgi:hypothetical protein
MVHQTALLATAEEFQELLSPASLSGVDSHTYELETVRRVVRVLRGRACAKRAWSRRRVDRSARRARRDVTRHANIDRYGHEP